MTVGEAGGVTGLEGPFLGRAGAGFPGARSEGGTSIKVEESGPVLLLPVGSACEGGLPMG